MTPRCSFWKRRMGLALAAGYRAGEAAAIAELALTTFLTGDASRAQELLERGIDCTENSETREAWPPGCESSAG